MDMQNAIAVMLRLQELEIILCEMNIMKGLINPDNVKKLENEIASLMATLPEQFRSRYAQLRKNGMAVAKEFGGVCQNCRMTLTIPLLNRMRQNETPWICPNCGHFLQLSPDGK